MLSESLGYFARIQPCTGEHFTLRGVERLKVDDSVDPIAVEAPGLLCQDSTVREPGLRCQDPKRKGGMIRTRADAANSVR